MYTLNLIKENNVKPKSVLKNRKNRVVCLFKYLMFVILMHSESLNNPPYSPFQPVSLSSIYYSVFILLLLSCYSYPNHAVFHFIPSVQNVLLTHLVPIFLKENQLLTLLLKPFPESLSHSSAV